MLIGCITTGDFHSIQTQLDLAKKYGCDQVELRLDLIQKIGFKLDVSQIHHPVFSLDQVISYHNWKETPLDLEHLAQKLLRLGKDGQILKLATRAKSSIDALRMLLVVKQYRSQIAGMCMGDFGKITRILAPVFGSPLTFVALGKGAFASQMQAKELVEVYNYHTLSKQTKVYCLIGNPVDQSPSHITHNAYFKREGLGGVYCKIPLERCELPQFFSLAKDLGISGMSVTIPYKGAVIPYLSDLSVDAKEIGAVNTITLKKTGFFGDNTDGKGALDVIEKRSKVQGASIILLGDGGTAKAICFEAKKRGADVTICSRKKGNLNQLFPCDILINATPSLQPILCSDFPKVKIFMDVNFKRQKSPLVQRGLKMNCQIIYGEEMFFSQANGQFTKWGQTPSS